ECTPWGSPAYNLFGWQKPCYLVQEGHTATFQELLDTTDWSQYGRASGNPKCANCMVHCGYEPTAVAETFNSWSGFWRVARLTMFGPPKRKAPPVLEVSLPESRSDDRARSVQLPVLTR
ncbi:MAG TPA: DUF3463 domain-containing protein, partial [Planctomycetaceae bacterium]|nr:DUF3463 domain-containing protein [Planctomycetaceae bacterium]